MAGTELTCELAFRLARAAGLAFRPQRALLALDTRLSGPALASACAAGLAEAGCDVDLAGVLPSPAVSHLVPRRGYGLGVVVSASHNPPQDNGVKFYGPDGLKLPPEDEARVEGLLDAPGGGRPPGGVADWAGAEAEYAAVLCAAAPDLALNRMKVVLDCAHGATARLAPEILTDLGAEVTVIGGEPDGGRINETGAAAPVLLSREVPACGAEIGVAFDGDGDRALFVDRRGTVVEGDRLMAALAPHLHAWGELSRPAVVFTVLANLGAEAYLLERGFAVERVPVGDRNVAWAMRERGIDLGGEPSGHVIFRRHASTGDGILTALLVLRALKRLGTDLGTLAAPVRLFPQVRADVPVAEPEAALADPAVQAAIQEAKAKLDGKGRLVVRPSGTQPLIRIMAEGADEHGLDRLVHDLKKALLAPGRRLL